MTLLPDVESIVVAYLKGHTGVLAIVDATNVASELRAKATFPYLTAAQGSGLVRVEGFLVGYRVQLDAWGTTREEARLLARTAQAALIELNGTQDLGIVTGVDTLTAPWAHPDPNTGTPRFTADMRVWAAPLPEQEAS